MVSLLLALMGAGSLFAEVKLPAVLGDHMVLQRNAEVNLWGEATPGGKVRVRTSWNDESYTVQADREGKWRLKVTTGEAGGPYTIRISDGEEVVLRDILLGEVWVCSGQSNMEMPVWGFQGQPVVGAADAVADAGSYPDIRLFTVPKRSLPAPSDDCEAAWQPSTPATVGPFSATAYFFGRMLHRMLGVPVGLVGSYWGGSTIESWMTKEAIDATQGIDHAVAKSGDRANSKVQHLYNGMICPIRNFTAKGFIWYQGESNRKNGMDYKQLMVSMVELWRDIWGDGKMPFYMVQLAPYCYKDADGASLPVVIESQYLAARELPHVGVAATTDLGHPTCIHPPHKQEVGARLAYLALGNDYGIEGLPVAAPTYRSMVREGNRVTLRFNHLADSGEACRYSTLATFTEKGSLQVKGFEIAGKDRVFHPATARITEHGTRIVVSSEAVPEPEAVRYAFRNYVPEANVVTTMGQPLAPFRTDNWPVDGMKR